MNIKGGSRRSYVTPVDYCLEDEMINERQKRLLTDYIQNLQDDDDEKEQKILQLDEMTSAEANEMLFEISKWQ